MWFFDDGAAAAGPVPGAAMAGLVRSGAVRPETMVWCAGMAGWAPAEGTALGGLFAGERPPPLPPEFAGFWIRLLAHAADFVVIQAVIAASFYVPSLGLPAAVLAAAAYYTAFTAGPWQATPGKLVARIRVVTVDGTAVGPWSAFGRYLAYFISAFVGMLGFLMVGATREKTGLHDLICGTRVVYRRPGQASANEAAANEAVGNEAVGKIV